MLKEIELHVIYPLCKRHHWIISLALLTVLGAAVVWFRHVTEPYREAGKLASLILSLADQRPVDMSPRQWESAVGWTSNLHHNSLVWGFTNGPAIRNLRVQMESKLDEPVTMDTIIWIWDRYAELCPAGTRYQRFRSVMLEAIDDGGGNRRPGI